MIVNSFASKDHKEFLLKMNKEDKDSYVNDNEKSFDCIEY